MRTGSAQVQPAHRRAVVGVAEHRPRRKELVEGRRAWKYFPADEAEVALEIERRQDPAGEDALLEIRGVAVDRFDDHVCRGLLLFVPAAAPGQDRVEVLAEETRDVRTLRSEPGVD